MVIIHKKSHLSSHSRWFWTSAPLMSTCIHVCLTENNQNWPFWSIRLVVSTMHKVTLLGQQVLIAACPRVWQQHQWSSWQLCWQYQTCQFIFWCLCSSKMKPVKCMWSVCDFVHVMFQVATKATTKHTQKCAYTCLHYNHTMLTEHSYSTTLCSLCSGEFVAQFKFTVLLMANGPLRITNSLFEPELYKSEHEVEDPELKVMRIWWKVYTSFKGTAMAHS